MSNSHDDLNEKYLQEGWGKIADAVGIRPVDMESQARLVAEYAAKHIYKDLPTGLQNALEAFKEHMLRQGAHRPGSHCLGTLIASPVFDDFIHWWFSEGMKTGPTDVIYSSSVMVGFMLEFVHYSYLANAEQRKKDEIRDLMISIVRSIVGNSKQRKANGQGI